MICVLQFDAASRSLLERMSAAGALPALTELEGRGRRVDLKGPAHAFAAAAFPTLYSGVEVGDHGIFYPFQWDPTAQRARYTTAFQHPAAVWERLAAAGRSTLALDPYECRPPATLEGTAISGWGFSERVVLPRWARPRSAGWAATRRFGRSPAATEVFGTPEPADLLRLRERLLPAPARVARLGASLLEERDFDLAWFTFSASHIGGHAFWDLSQLPPGRLDDRTARLLGGTLEELYAEVDAAIGGLAARLSEEDSLLLVSPVGMDVNTSRADLLPEMLAAVLAGAPAQGDGAQGAIWRLRGAFPPAVRRRVAAALPARVANELTARLELRGMDWGATRAFAHPADNQGYIRFNLRGRERDGIVAPEEVDELTSEIERGLRSFADPDGKPAVSAVESVPERYAGRRADLLPDLVVHWSERPATRLSHVVSPDFGTVRRRGGGSGRSGNHTPGDAWAIAVPGAGVEHAGADGARRLVDVAATVCELTGTPRSGLAGSPLLART